MDLEHAKRWKETGSRIAQGFADKLDDGAAGIEYSKYFYLIYLFDGDNGTGAVPVNVLQYSMKQLTRRRSSISSSSPLKELLGTFLSYSTLMFNNESARNDAYETLKREKLMPTAVDVLGEKVGSKFVSERYDEKIGERLKTTRDRLGWWGKLNWRVMALGEWFGENKDIAGAIIGILACLPLVCSLLMWVFKTFTNEGWGWGLLCLWFCGIVGYYGCGIILGLSVLITKAVFWVLRLIFYNLYTLILFIILIIWRLLA